MHQSKLTCVVLQIQGGSAGRWKTPHQKAKLAERVELGTTLAVGDEGIWVTYARGMKFKAIREFKDLCIEVRKFYHKKACLTCHHTLSAYLLFFSCMKSRGRRIY